MIIPKDVAEQVYANYSGTLRSPVPFEDFITEEAGIITISDKMRFAYKNGTVEVKDQIARIHAFHVKHFDPGSVYDLAVLCTMEMFMRILGMDVPEREVEAVESEEVDEPVEPSPEDQPLEKMLKVDLLSIATSIPEITGESRMTKAQLIEAIEAAK